VGHEGGGWYNCFIFMMSQTDISSQTLTILNNVKKPSYYSTPPQKLWNNTLKDAITASSTSFPIHYSLITLLFDDTATQQMNILLNYKHINK
jgi:hypothetical protein